MEVALIAPPSMVWTIGNMTRYHMIVPEALKDAQYRNYYRGAPGYKMLDNGAAEGRQMGDQELIDFGYLLQVDEIVVPDTMMEADETCKQVAHFLPRALANPNFKYMAVCQGNTPAAFDACMMYLLSQDWINTIAFPRCMQDIPAAGGWGARPAAIEHWRDRILKADKEIHCLGSTGLLNEVKRLSNIYGVRGIDTCAPIVQGLKGLTCDALYEGRKGIDPYFEVEVPLTPTAAVWGGTNTSVDERAMLVISNCNTYLEWAQHGEQRNPFDSQTSGEETPPASEV